MWDGVRGPENDLRLAMHFPLRWTAKRAILEFRVLPLPVADTDRPLGSDCFLGVRINRFRIDHSTPSGLPSPSGFEIGGPSDLRRGQHVAETLKATYPKPADIGDLDDAKSLDYAPDDMPSPGGGGP